MTRDPLDTRILGAIRFIDAVTRAAITAPLVVEADGVRFIRNLSGLYAIAEAPGTSRYSGTLVLPRPPEAPLPPPIGDVEILLTVVDRSGRYLARQATIDVPRDPDPANADQPGSVFKPVEVELFPSSTMPVAEGWATLRISVKRAGSQIGLPYAFVRVRRASDDVVLARGLADERGEVLVGIPGIPVTTWGADPTAPVTATSVTARVHACFDPELAASSFPDPEALEAAFSSLPHSSDLQVNLASGREVAHRIDVTVP